MSKKNRKLHATLNSKDKQRKQYKRKDVIRDLLFKFVKRGKTKSGISDCIR
jgi:hypothetical protein